MKAHAKKYAASLLSLFAPASIRLNHFREDLSAGIIVAVVAIPLCLALAVASGVPPAFGIYTGIIAGILVAFFGGTELGVAGPAAAMTVLLYSVVDKFGVQGLLMAGLMAGLIQIILGTSGIGRAVKFIPYTVVVGFTTGIGVLILIGQLGNFTGVNAKAEGSIGQLSAFAANASHANPWALLLGVLTLALLFSIPHFFKKVPASFVALTTVTALAVWGGWNVATIGTVPSGLPPFSLPNFPLANIGDLFAPALAIALLASIESLLSAVSLDGMTGTKHSSSKELVGQGIANMVLPFFSGIACTGVIVRSATNVKNGGKTRLSAIIHAIILVLVLVVLAPLAQWIPMPVLAAILMYTALHLIALDEIRHFLKDSKSDVAVLGATVLSTVFLELTTAILVGFTLAGLFFIKKMSDNVEVTAIPESSPAQTESTLAENISGVAKTYRVSGPLFFGSAHVLERIADETPGERYPALVVDMLDVDYMDSSAIAILAGLCERRKERGEVYLAVTNTKVRKKILNSEVMEFVRAENLVPSVAEGLSRAKARYGSLKTG